MDETSDLYRDAVRQARDLLRWRSPLRAELWASRLAASWRDDEEAAGSFLARVARDDTPEARLVLTALASLSQLPDADEPPTAHGADTGEPTVRGEGAGQPAAHRGDAGVTPTAHGADISEPTVHRGDATVTPGAYASTRDVAAAGVPRWMELMGRARPESAWYGTADPYGEQALAVISFVYPNEKEPHLAVVAIDQANGGFAVDAVIEEPKFLEDLDVRPADPVRVAGRIIDAFDLTDAVLGAPVAETLPQARAIVLARAHATENPVLGAKSPAGSAESPARAPESSAPTAEVPAVSAESASEGVGGGRRSPDDTVDRFDDLPDVPGADEAFATLVEFLGDRPSWWSPARVTQFLTSWLPREAIMSEAAVAAMPQVLRAWTRHLGDHPEVVERVETDSRDLPLLMADGLRFSLGKRLRLAEREHRGTDR
ncbi:hypothetical protein [Nonomuraea sp. NPDC003804]|uniref:hypothetical protein n=1 Tax=Nonomuraea sp. NPDC003804 TaxID=3154547 RepID=UPI0033A176B6